MNVTGVRCTSGWDRNFRTPPIVHPSGFVPDWEDDSDEGDEVPALD